MSKPFLPLAAFSAGVGVAMGAFGAHALKTLLTPEMLEVYKTGVNYQMWHALGLGVIGVAQRQAPPSRLLYWSGWLMFIGIVLFSGSLYALTLLDMPPLGMLTPFGGVAFLLAWLLFGIFALQHPDAVITKQVGRYGR